MLLHAWIFSGCSCTTVTELSGSGRAGRNLWRLCRDLRKKRKASNFLSSFPLVCREVTSSLPFLPTHQAISSQKQKPGGFPKCSCINLSPAGCFVSKALPPNFSDSSDHVLSHRRQTGSLALCPAGRVSSADTSKFPKQGRTQLVFASLFPCENFFGKKMRMLLEK